MASRKKRIDIGTVSLKGQSHLEVERLLDHDGERVHVRHQQWKLYVETDQVEDVRAAQERWQYAKQPTPIRFTHQRRQRTGRAFVVQVEYCGETRKPLSAKLILSGVGPVTPSVRLEPERLALAQSRSIDRLKAMTP